MIEDNQTDTERSDIFGDITKETLAVMESTPYINKLFKRYDDAAIFQRSELTRLIGEGFVIREAALNSEVNIDLNNVSPRLETWYVFIRCYPKYKLVASSGA